MNAFRKLAAASTIALTAICVNASLAQTVQTSGQPKLNAGKSVVLALFGPATMISQVASADGLFSQFDANFQRFSELHWRDHSEKWEIANYYDRARIYYVFWGRSGNPTYLERGHAIAVDYRDKYLAANRYGASTHWAQMAGVLLHARLTKDPKSREAVLKVAETFSAPYYLDNLGRPSAEMDNRMQARVLTAMLYAWILTKENSGGAAESWAGKLRQALGDIMRSQSADGAFRFSRSQCDFAKPFMTGMLLDALIEYHDLFEPDERIAPVIKASVDYLWLHAYDAGSAAFLYLEGDCKEERREPAPDLNLMIVNGFGFVFSKTGDERYRERGDQIFAGGVRKAWLQNPKIFNQNYATAYRYLAYRK
jgi:hypothetical protein